MVCEWALKWKIWWDLQICIWDLTHIHAHRPTLLKCICSRWFPLKDFCLMVNLCQKHHLKHPSVSRSQTKHGRTMDLSIFVIWSFRYAEDVPYVLKGITVNIIPSEKVQVSIYIEVQWICVNESVNLICTCVLSVDNMELSIFILTPPFLNTHTDECVFQPWSLGFNLLQLRYSPETNRQKNVPQGHNFRVFQPLSFG